MKTWKSWILLLTFCAIAGFAGSFTLMRIAEAQGIAAVDAGISTAPPVPEGPSTSPQIVGINWNPIDWPWDTILLWVFTILGALIAALRPISRLTKWTFDDKVVARLEWLMALLLKVFTPPAVRAASLGRGKTLQPDDNVKFPKFPDGGANSGKTGSAS